MFPQEPYSQVGGCTHNLTQTTQVQARYPLPVARVRGYYYVPSSALSHGSLSRVLPLEGAGQRACTVPTSATTLYRQYSTNVQQAQDFRPSGSGAFIPSRERRRDFPRRFVNAPFC